MATVTKVSAQKRPGRYNIFLEGKYAFSVAEKTLTNFVLLPGKELTSQQIEKIKQYDADAQASNLAARYLNYEPRSIYELLTYLKKHQITSEAAKAAVQELTDLGYLDDREYCRLFIKNNLQVGKSGPRDLERKLRQKGVAPDLIEETLAQVTADDWLKIGTKVIKSLPRQLGRYSYSELKRKMQTRLLSHGFTSELARAVISQSNLQADDQLQQQALIKQGLKAYRRYRNLPLSQRRYKTKNYLFQHGFQSGEIDLFLDGSLVDLEHE